MNNPRPIEILLVDDNPGDARLTQEALRDGEVRSRLTVVPDGVEAMEYRFIAVIRSAEDFWLTVATLPRE